jgi:hypothetical protein
MACRLCGSADHTEEVCPVYQPSGELEAISMRAPRASTSAAAMPFRDLRTQVRLTLAQREEDPARTWLELVSVRESAKKLAELAKDDAPLLEEIERFRAKLEAEIFALTQEVGDEVLAPLYVWLDLIRRRNKLDRDILVSRQHVKEARASRIDTTRAPRTLDESSQQLEEATKVLDAWRATAPPEPSERAREVWNLGGWSMRTGELPQDVNDVRIRAETAQALLAWTPARWPLGKPPFIHTRSEVTAIAVAGVAVLVSMPLTAVGVASGGGVGAAVLAVVAALAWALLAAVVAASLWLRGRARKELDAAVAVVWRAEIHVQREKALESEVGWIRALRDGFRARRTFDESKAEGKQIEDLKVWRPDLRDFVVEVAKQHDDPLAVQTALQSLRPPSGVTSRPPPGHHSP